MEGILKSYNPADGTLIGEVPVTPISELPAIVERAKRAQIKWATLDVDERIRVLMQAYQVLGAKKREIGTLLSMEQGKDLRRGIGEVSGCAGSIGYVTSGVKSAIEPVVRRGYGKTIVNFIINNNNGGKQTADLVVSKDAKKLDSGDYIYVLSKL
jgi:succinate-semialdehyde dehydrogenase/glutarate-semialdehyde dehydrogenase